MNTSLFCPLQTWISEAMLEAEGGWGKYPKQGTRAREREIRVQERRDVCANKKGCRKTGTVNQYQSVGYYAHFQAEQQ